MRRRARLPLLLLAVAGVVAVLGYAALRLGVNPPPPAVLSGVQSPDNVPYLEVPEPFRLKVFADALDGPRMLRVTASGDVLVSLPRTGSVLLLRDADGDGQAELRQSLLADLNRPHGLALHEGWLYVAETDQVGRIAFDAKTGRVEGDYQVIATGLPSGKGHWTRTLGVGPDGWLYVSVGSSCNVCIEKDAERAAILRMRVDGSAREIYATGLRNSVGFDWSPLDGALYATDNGRDWLGDDFPPDELNRIVAGGVYGWPYVNGDRVPDPDYGDALPYSVEESIAPVYAFRAHNAPLGMAFVELPQLNASVRQTALVALHGSWNRSTRDGYKVVALHWRSDGEIEAEDFMTGFLVGEKVQGRPVDVAQGPGGELYITDDYAGRIYRISPKNGTKRFD